VSARFGRTLLGPGAVKFIRSPENPVFRQLLALRDSARERREEGKTLIEGAHLLEAYIENTGMAPELIVIDEQSAGRPDLQKLLARAPDAPSVSFDSRLFSKISPVAGANAVLALIPVRADASLNALTTGGFQLWLDGVQDPGNVGSLIRSAAASGAKVIVLGPGCADPWSPKCLRGGMGGHFAMRLIEVDDLAAAASEWPGRILVAEANSLATVFVTNLIDDVAIILGAEGAGVGDHLKARATGSISIPMPGSIESLNVAAAGAVFCFERLRQTLDCGRGKIVRSQAS